MSRSLNELREKPTRAPWDVHAVPWGGLALSKKGREAGGRRSGHQPESGGRRVGLKAEARSHRACSSQERLDFVPNVMEASGDTEESKQLFQSYHRLENRGHEGKRRSRRPQGGC